MSVTFLSRSGFAGDAASGAKFCVCSIVVGKAIGLIASMTLLPPAVLTMKSFGRGEKSHSR